MPEPKIKNRLVKSYDWLDLKVYILDIGRYIEGLEHLDTVVRNNINSFMEIGDLGVASIYGYTLEKRFVNGTSIWLIRGSQHEYFDPDNPMVHPFCFENCKRILDLGKGGGFCRKEGIIFGRELELFRRLKERDRYLKEWAFDIEI